MTGSSAEVTDVLQRLIRAACNGAAGGERARDADLPEGYFDAPTLAVSAASGHRSPPVPQHS